MRKLILTTAAAALFAAGCHSNTNSANAHNQGASNNTVGASETADRTHRNPSDINNPNPTLADSNAATAGQAGQMQGVGQNGAQSQGAQATPSAVPPELLTSQMALDRLHAINQEEIHAGKMAEKNGTKMVQAYGKELVKDHEALDKDVSKTAKVLKLQVQDPSKVSWPQQIAQQNHDGQKMMDQLEGMKGKQFDSQFLTMMVQGHTQAREYLKALQQDAKDEQVKQLATAAAPKIQAHLTRAQQLMGQTGTTVQGRR